MRSLKTVSSKFWSQSCGLTTLEFSLFSGGLVLALGLIIMPMAENYANNKANNNLDMTTTASVDPSATVKRITRKKVVSVTRSILHGPNGEVCIRYADGTNNGHC